jgi:hypothetical protein
MKESIINKKLLRMMFGFIFIGGGAAILGIYHAAKNARYSLRYAVKEYDADVFV